jgi:curved DNA-binding protein
MDFGGSFNFTRGPGGERIFRQNRQTRGNRNVQVRMAVSIKEAMNNNEKTINYKLPSGRDEFATVKIPAGVQHGVTFKFQGMGDDSIKNMPRGDLMVVMSVLDSDGYTRKGNDLYTDKTIDCFQAIRGHEFNLKTLEDKIIKVKVPAGTQHGTFLSVKGRGMPVHRTVGIRGNLYVKVHILIPQLSAQDLKKIKDL